jgi:hypothetical protein
VTMAFPPTENFSPYGEDSYSPPPPYSPRSARSR